MEAGGETVVRGEAPIPYKMFLEIKSSVLPEKGRKSCRLGDNVCKRLLYTQYVMV